MTRCVKTFFLKPKQSLLVTQGSVRLKAVCVPLVCAISTEKKKIATIAKAREKERKGERN